MNHARQWSHAYSPHERVSRPRSSRVALILHQRTAIDNSIHDLHIFSGGIHPWLG